ncbi:hypothetical protein [Flavobacterium sp.]
MESQEGRMLFFLVIAERPKEVPAIAIEKKHCDCLLEMYGWIGFKK